MKKVNGGDGFMLTVLLRASYVCYSPFSSLVLLSGYFLLVAPSSFVSLLRPCTFLCELWLETILYVCKDPCSSGELTENPLS
jgi:hypothetical protein